MAYLRLTNRFKILEEHVLEENDLQAEVTASKQRHSQAKEAGVQYRDNKERLELAEREWEERAIQQGDCVSFGRMRTTDLRFNKRIDSEDEEDTQPRWTTVDPSGVMLMSSSDEEDKETDEEEEKVDPSDVPNLSDSDNTDNSDNEGTKIV